MTIIINIKKEISSDMLENVFVTALEGGSNYWYWIDSDSIRKVRELMPDKKNTPLSVAIFKAVIEYQMTIPVYDAETKDVIGALNPISVATRLEHLANDANYKWALENELEENGDANSSDIIFQYLVMGEVVYG
jgi:hypothetical protein